MSGHEARIWAFALSISLGVHGALLWQARMPAAESGRGKPNTTVTRVRFNSPSSAPSKMSAVTPPKPKPKPKPPVEKAPKAAEVPVEKKTQEEEPPREAALQSPESGREDSTAPVPGAASLNDLRRSYQTQLLAHIESRKFYPEAARRRGIVGGVRVEFMVEAGGVAAGLECGQGPGILVQAACESVRRAVPLPMPPRELQLPLSVSFVMDYSLK